MQKSPNRNAKGVLLQCDLVHIGRRFGTYWNSKFEKRLVIKIVIYEFHVLFKCCE